VVRSAIYLVTALRRPLLSVSATAASSLATFRAPAPTRALWIPSMFLIWSIFLGSPTLSVAGGAAWPIVRDCDHDLRSIDTIMTFLYIFSFYGLVAVFQRLHEKHIIVCMIGLGSWKDGNHEETAFGWR